MPCHNQPEPDAQAHSSDIVVRCNDANTGSFGCVLRSADVFKVALGAHPGGPAQGGDREGGDREADTGGAAPPFYVYNASSLVSLLGNRHVSRHLRCFDAYTDVEHPRPVDINSLRDSLASAGGGGTHAIAIKVFRGSFKDPDKRTEAVFREELHKIKLLERKLDAACFSTITTYRKCMGTYAFVLRPADASVNLIIQHKPTYTSIALDALCMIIQESCVTSVSSMFSGAPGAADSGPASRKPLLDQLDRDVSFALRALHAAGVAHGDIKPHNIVYCPQSSDRKFKLVDYGLVQSTDGLPARLTGTKMYMSPFYIAAVAKSVPDLVRANIKDTCRAFTHAKTRQVYRELLRIYITGIRDYTGKITPRYVLLKNDEYAYMVTLCCLYDLTLERRLLRKAMIIALNPGTTFSNGADPK